RGRADPLRRWNIGQQRDGQGLERTSLPEPDAASAPRASAGVRRFADASSAGGSEPWRAAVRGAAHSREPELPEALDQAIARTDLRSRAGSWWRPQLDVRQRLVRLIGAVGCVPWRAAVRGARRSREPELPAALAHAIARTDLRSRAGSWWWPVLAVLQWLVLLIGVVGLGWLALNMVLALFQLPPPPMPMI